ncbi:UNVERIFIED_CONTAM: hypothetical protein PYX00_009714 [Menopon gallinae]|uniref:AAA+ ATPase domain-containing protein n=1 Tax=Menopon gallinae TaxID=328185 RepID=A0AAW2HCP7_9NEOP
MSSKKSKSIVRTWYICDICKSILQMKDTSVHKENSCRMNENGLLHPYIKDEVLYTKPEIFKLDDITTLKSLPPEVGNDYILLSVNALQFLKVPIGDPVVIRPMNESAFEPFVKYAWPTSQKNFSAFFSKQVVSVYNLDSLIGVTIHPLREPINIAKQIKLECITTSDIPEQESFLLSLKDNKLRNIYCIGNKLSHTYFGKLLIFQITNIIPLIEHGSNYSSEKHTEFFLVTEETVFNIEQSAISNSNSTPEVKKIAGLDETCQELENILSLALFGDQSISSMYMTRGVIIFGPAGTGKSTLVEVLAEKFNVNVIRVETSQIFSKFMGEAEKRLLQYFAKAKQSSPSIILIDELDVICPKSDDKHDQEKRIIAMLSLLLDKIHDSRTQPVLVCGTTSKINDIHKSLRRPGRFGKEIEIFVPNSSQRREILKVHLENIKHDLNDDDIKEIADMTHGFVGADLVSLVSKAALRHYKRDCGDNVSVSDFQWALTKVKPSSMRELLIEVPNVSWSDIGGQEELKLKLKQAVEWPLKFEDSFKRLGIVPPRGLLMFGPPGCSKTMIAKALATESKLNFISVKGPELFSKWVGDSEKAVREVFRKARQAAPSIVFFDELDAIGGERNTSSANTSVEERVLAQLLTELDGVEPLGNVTVVGATNRLDRIDPALLRPGRFDRIVYVPLPDAKTRSQIFSLQFKKTPVGEDVSLDELVQKTEGYSGAEVVAVCHEAALKALEEDMNSCRVLRKHFLIALTIILPRTPQSLIKIYENYLNK